MRLIGLAVCAPLAGASVQSRHQDNLLAEFSFDQAECPGRFFSDNVDTGLLGSLERHNSTH